MNQPHLCAQIILFFLLFLGAYHLVHYIIFYLNKVDTLGCGGYVQVVTNDSITLSSPSNFTNGTRPTLLRCIWLLEAPPEYAIFFYGDFYGKGGDDSNKLTCHDFVEIRDGSLVAPVRYFSCNNAAFNLTSPSRWLWVLFSSVLNNPSDSRLNATFVKKFIGSSLNSVQSPIPECRSHQFMCSNKECISTSYLCDGYLDCGCGDGNCDEDNCGGIVLPARTGMIMGIGIGTGLFMIVCVMSVVWERRHNWARIQQQHAAEKKRKKRKT